MKISNKKFKIINIFLSVKRSNTIKIFIQKNNLAKI